MVRQTRNSNKNSAATSPLDTTADDMPTPIIPPTSVTESGSKNNAKSAGRTNGGSRKKPRKAGRPRSVSNNNEEPISSSPAVAVERNPPSLPSTSFAVIPHRGTDDLSSDEETTPQPLILARHVPAALSQMEPPKVKTGKPVDFTKKTGCRPYLFSGNKLEYSAITAQDMQDCLADLSEIKGRDVPLTPFQIFSHVQANHLSGTALRWARQWVSAHRETKDFGGTAHSISAKGPYIEDFITQFKNRFQAGKQAGVIMTQLQKFEQREPLLDYITSCCTRAEPYLQGCPESQLQARKDIVLCQIEEGLHHAYSHLGFDSWEDLERAKPSRAADKMIQAQFKEWKDAQQNRRGARNGRYTTGSSSRGRGGAGSENDHHKLPRITKPINQPPPPAPPPAPPAPPAPPTPPTAIGQNDIILTDPEAFISTSLTSQLSGNEYKSSTQPRHLYWVKLEGLPELLTLFDSGSCLNLIRNDALSEQKRYPAPTRNLLSANKIFMESVNQYVMLNIPGVEDEVPFYISSTISFPVIFGEEVVDKFLTIPSQFQKADPELQTEVINSTSEDPIDTIFAQMMVEATDDTNQSEEIVKFRELVQSDLDYKETPARWYHKDKNGLGTWIENFKEQNKDILHNNEPTKAANKYPYYHHIQIDPTKPLPRTAPYAKSFKQREQLSRDITRLLNNNFIQPSQSSVSSGVVYAPKHEGEDDRFCVDYRKLNEATIKDNYPLPAIESLLELVAGKMVYYLDDILIFSDSIAAHKIHLAQVFSILRENNFIAKEKKCEFFLKRIHYLGHIVGMDGIKPTEEKIEAVQNWPLPETPKSMATFIGFISYNRRFIQGFAALARPLHLFANKKIPMTEDVRQNFQLLKERITRAPVLVPPTRSGRYIITTDASDYSMGSIIEVCDEKTLKRKGVVAYFSKTLRGAELNYPVREKELLSVVRTLERFRHLLVDHKLIVRTDHHSLQFLMNSQKPISARLSRWMDVLADFDLEFCYIKGAANPADGLSRYVATISTEDVTSTLLQNQILGDKFFDDVKENYHKDDKFALIYTTLKNKSSVPKSMKEYIKKFHICHTTGLLYYHGLNNLGDTVDRLVIPTPDLQRIVMDKHHNTPTALHGGIFPTYAELTRYYYWTNMNADIRQFVHHCQVCQTTKPRNTLTNGLLKPLTVPNGPWQSISLDFISGIPEVNGFDNILVVVDRFTRRSRFFPCKKTITAQETADIFIKNILPLHGVPLEFISDRDPRFTSQFWKDFFGYWETKLKMSTPGHAQTDGSTERVNRNLIRYFKALELMGTRWLQGLPLIEFAYNNAVHDAIKMSPFMAELGRDPRPPHLDSRILQHEARRQLPFNQSDALGIHEIHEYLRQLISDQSNDAQRKMEAQANKKRTELLLVPGDKVLVDVKSNLMGYHFSKRKTKPIYFGPYTVEQKINDNAYRIGLAAGKYDRNFNVKHLKKYHFDDLLYPRIPPSTPVELRCRAREITGIQAWDQENKLVAFTFDGTAPFHAAFFRIEDVLGNVPPDILRPMFERFDDEVAEEEANKERIVEVEDVT
ncbi:hypothetical protein G210_1757 [Candida maltosa Xu316]|uniref:Integrase catalytic domain-containing protein n=1 Tax=Candida maltosa (strain Xu316) TaxID=1245528 RepID=M3J6U3_CANMX|nr:hypothetical protein G210_1757 [Candida maltosa Xu316]